MQLERKQQFCLAFFTAVPVFLRLFYAQVPVFDVQVDPPDNCVHDVHKWMVGPLTVHLRENETFRRFLLISDSLLIDLLLLYALYQFIRRGNKLLLGTLLFYALRSASLLTTGQWPRPEPYMFAYPGFPSLFVPYDATNDLFFSGHTGLLIAMFRDALHHRQQQLSVITAAIALYTMIMLFVTGAHYLNDIIIGFIAALVSVRAIIAYKYLISYLLLKSYCHVLELCARMWRATGDVRDKLIENYVGLLERSQKRKSN